MTPARTVLVALLLSVLAGVTVLAGVAVYEIIGFSVTAIRAPVVWEPGPNAGAQDLSGTITVQIGGNGTALNLTIHPTYQYTLYPRIANLTNRGNQTYNVSVVVANPIAIPGGWAVLYLLNGTNMTASVNLSSTGSTFVGSLKPGGTLEAWLLVYIPEGSRLTSYSGVFYAAYSPSNETAPLPPG